MKMSIFADVKVFHSDDKKGYFSSGGGFAAHGSYLGHDRLSDGDDWGVSPEELAFIRSNVGDSEYFIVTYNFVDVKDYMAIVYHELGHVKLGHPAKYVSPSRLTAALEKAGVKGLMDWFEKESAGKPAPEPEPINEVQQELDADAFAATYIGWQAVSDMFERNRHRRPKCPVFEHRAALALANAELFEIEAEIAALKELEGI